MRKQHRLMALLSDEPTAELAGLVTTSVRSLIRNHPDAIMPIQSHLDQLRRATEFPSWRVTAVEPCLREFADRIQNDLAFILAKYGLGQVEPSLSQTELAIAILDGIETAIQHLKGENHHDD